LALSFNVAIRTFNRSKIYRVIASVNAVISQPSKHLRSGHNRYTRREIMQRHCHSVVLQRTAYAGAVSQADTSSGCRCCEHSLIDIVHTHTRAVIDSGTEKYGVRCAEINIVSRDLVGPSHLLVCSGDELQTPILYALGLHAVYHPRRDMPHVASRYARTHAEYTEARNQARSAGGRTRDVVQRSKCYKNSRAYFLFYFLLVSF